MLKAMGYCSLLECNEKITRDRQRCIVIVSRLRAVFGPTRNTVVTYDHTDLIDTAFFIFINVITRIIQKKIVPGYSHGARR